MQPDGNSTELVSQGSARGDAHTGNSFQRLEALAFEDHARHAASRFGADGNGLGMSEAMLRAVERAVVLEIANGSTFLATVDRIARLRWNWRLLLTGASVALLTALSAESASAQTWTGATSNDWTVGSNWNGGTVPGGGAGVTISTGSGVVLGVNGAASGATGGLIIGGTSAGLTIQNGSTLTSGNTVGIAATAGSTIVVTVTGAGSLWTASGSLHVGGTGTGTLNIANGGEVIAQAGMEVGVLAGSSGTLNITSGGILQTTTLTRPAAATGQVNFDNATLVALANNGSAFISGFSGTQLNIAAGGLTVDTNGFTVGTLGFTGVGGLTVSGGGTFFLQATNRYAGQTLIESGSTLALQTVGNIAASSGVVANGTFDISAINATGTSIQSLAGSGTVAMGAKSLTLTNANDTFAGAFTGSSGLTLAGGTETLTGNSSTITGANTVQAGTLIVNGNLGGTMDVLSGAILQGNGTVDATTIHTGGTVSPGSSSSTLHVNGVFTQQAGSTYQAQLDPTSNASSQIAVSGAASVQTGAQLSASADKPGNYSPNTVYKVLSADGGLTGTYTLVGTTAVSAYLSLVGVYDANDAYLKVVQTGDPGSAAQTSNQASTANGASGTGAETALLNSQSAAAARNALDQLSGSSLASAKGAMIYDSRYTRALAIDRLRDMFCTAGHASQSISTTAAGALPGNGCAVNPGGFAVWGQAFGAWGRSNGNANAAAVDRSSSGFVAGIDTAVGDD
jgi:T5SS/PEP-CTERM-associated repeat protein